MQIHTSSVFFAVGAALIVLGMGFIAFSPRYACQPGQCSSDLVLARRNYSGILDGAFLVFLGGLSIVGSWMFQPERERLSEKYHSE